MPNFQLLIPRHPLDLLQQQRALPAQSPLPVASRCPRLLQRAIIPLPRGNLVCALGVAAFVLGIAGVGGSLSPLRLGLGFVEISRPALLLVIFPAVLVNELFGFFFSLLFLFVLGSCFVIIFIGVWHGDLVLFCTIDLVFFGLRLDVLGGIRYSLFLLFIAPAGQVFVFFSAVFFLFSWLPPLWFRPPPGLVAELVGPDLLVCLAYFGLVDEVLLYPVICR